MEPNLPAANCLARMVGTTLGCCGYELCVYSPTKHLEGAWDPRPQTNEQQQRRATESQVRVTPWTEILYPRGVG